MALWLALTPAGRGVTRALHALPRRHAVAELPFDAAGRTRQRFRRSRQLSRARRRSDLLAVAVEQPLVRGRDDSAVDCTRAADGGMGERQDRRPRAAAARL